MAKIRAILSLDGATGHAGEVAINLTNQPGATPVFRTATVSVEGAYNVSMSTEETIFLAMRSDGVLLVHVGPNTGTMARFHIDRVDGFEYALSPRETRYSFIENRPGPDSKLTVSIRW